MTRTTTEPRITLDAVSRAQCALYESMDTLTAVWAEHDHLAGQSAHHTNQLRDALKRAERDATRLAHAMAWQDTRRGQGDHSTVVGDSVTGFDSRPLQ